LKKSISAQSTANLFDSLNTLNGIQMKLMIEQLEIYFDNISKEVVDYETKLIPLIHIIENYQITTILQDGFSSRLKDGKFS